MADRDEEAQKAVDKAKTLRTELLQENPLGFEGMEPYKRIDDKAYLRMPYVKSEDKEKELELAGFKVTEKKNGKKYIELNGEEVDISTIAVRMQYDESKGDKDKPSTEKSTIVIEEGNVVGVGNVLAIRENILQTPAGGGAPSQRMITEFPSIGKAMKMDRRGIEIASATFTFTAMPEDPTKTPAPQISADPAKSGVTITRDGPKTAKDGKYQGKSEKRINKETLLLLKISDLLSYNNADSAQPLNEVASGRAPSTPMIVKADNTLAV